VVIDKAGKLAAVNRADLESYLEGVVPSEMPASYPDGALEAQAAAARSMTKVMLERGGNGEPYDICSDQFCQVYTGRTRWDARTARAVRATAGLVLKHGERVVPTYFSANCGGHGENVEHVWGGDPHPSLKGKPDAPAGQSTFPVPLTESGLATWLGTPAAMDHCGDSAGVANPHHRWVVKLGSKGLDGLVNKRHKVGSVTRITPLARGASGRLIALEVTGTKKTVVVRKELEIRRLLGGLKSSLFVVRVTRNRSGQPTAWELRGAGFGHGAGMCQNGARGMALIGRPFPEILAHYYPDSQLVKLY
jgi:SpoIID/LytB domain protein